MRKKRSFKHFLRFIYIKLLRFKDSPEKIALSFSIGVFIGIFPTFGLGGLLVIIISYLFKLNYAAGLLGTFIMNYFTSPFFWTLSYFVGDIITSGKVEWRSISRESFKSFALSYLVGNLIVSAIFSIVSYFLIKNLIINYKKRRGRTKNSSSP